jgi:hypothetical protein
MTFKLTCMTKSTRIYCFITRQKNMLLPLYRFDGQIQSSRKKFDHKFGEQNINYISQKLWLKTSFECPSNGFLLQIIHILLIKFTDNFFLKAALAYWTGGGSTKDDDQRHDRGDWGDGAKYHDWSWSWWENGALERVKLLRTIARKKLTPGKVLHRKTIDKTIIINSKLMNRDKITRCNEDIAKMKWAIIR